MTPLAFSGVLILITCIFLTSLIYKTSRGRRLNRLWLYFNVSTGLWGLATAGVGLAKSPSISIFWWKLGYCSGLLLGVIFFHISTVFCGTEKSRKFLITSSYVFWFSFLVLSITGLTIQDVRLTFDSIYYNTPNLLFSAAMVFWIFIVCFTHYELFLGLNRSNDPTKKVQIKYFMIGMATGFIGGGTIFLPVYQIPVYPYGNFSIAAYCLIVTYAIFKHQLMDIEVIVKRTVVFAGLVASVVGVVSMVAFISQDLLVRFVQIPKWLSNILAAAIIAAVYGRLRDWLVNATDKYLFQKKYDYRELLRKFSDEVAVGIRDLKQLVQMTVERLVDTVKLESCSFILMNRETHQYDIAGSKGAGELQVTFEEHEPFITFLRQTHEPIGLDGVLGNVRFPEQVTQRLKQLKARLCLPLIVHEDLVGVLCLGKKKSDEEFTKDDLDSLATLANTVAIAVNNAEVLDELRATQAQAAQKEKLAVIGTLSAGINHEICNPLGIVKAQCEAFLLDQEDGILVGKSSQELLERSGTIMRVALKQIDRATAITQKLSNFAKPIKQATMQPVSVDQEVDEVLALVGHDLKLDKIEVKKEIQPDVPPIVVDRRQLQEVLFNLIRNAGQAITPPGSITVRAHLRGTDVRIEIADTGSGIPADKLEKIYDPFFTTKEPGKGTGLGLFIVRQIVERNKGRISLESTVGQGTTFFLDFPAGKPAPQPALA